ncbi:Nsp1-like C-terminal region [Carpediemonas membranifera]|uniref:Nsp1-like C-terminal region n=1 Tax=Carpediemonas membranifera TaxID=201153 RepID=A0A8J6E019_9EUKA|nr:Nsp1-like C-terminal region [Carpediemonas membranifera]|eukprot:KAG9391538.1 Nsp1-like C-terminal region [Carpediemonas membranifera]
MEAKTLDQVVGDWNKRVQELKGAFENQANQVSRWDTQLVGIAEDTNSVASAVLKLEEQATNLENQLQGIEASQKDLATSLKTAQESLSKKLGAIGSDKSSKARVEALNSVEELFDELRRVQATLYSVFGRVQPVEGGDGLLDLLNNHLSSLQWIRDSVSRLDKEVSTLERKPRP